MKFIRLTYSMVLFFFISFSNHSLAEDRATPEDIIKKVYEAAAFLSQADESGLETFNEKNGRWVFKDTYVFVFDCSKGNIVAHPIKPTLLGRNLMGLKDVRGNFFFAQLCDAAKKPEGGWVEYWWPKVGEKKPSRKVSLLFQIPNTSYQVGSGIYDDNVTIKNLEKLIK
ncbi:MAG TPA: calcium:proton antiporter [Desulfobacterales bacterium]|nr:calcium:proton antiporter [Desulfobacterales bacterium]